MPPTTTLQTLGFFESQIRESVREKLAIVFEKNGILHVPKTGADLVPVPVFEEGQYGLLACTREMLDVHIVWPAVSAHSNVHAYMKKYRVCGQRTQHAEVVVTPANYCNSRFFAAKELLHCSMDNDGYPATGTFEDVELLIDELITGQIIDVSPQSAIDQVAWVGAIDYLFPESWRLLLYKILNDLMEAGYSEQDAYSHAAMVIRAPVWLVKFALRKYSK